MYLRTAEPKKFGEEEAARGWFGGGGKRPVVVCALFQIPVFKGASECLLGALRRTEAASHVHGTDGLGGVAHTMPVDESKIAKEDAVNWLVRCVCQEYPHQITLITLGPLTNVALASRMDSHFKTSLKRLCVMGGNHFGLFFSILNMFWFVRYCFLYF